MKKLLIILFLYISTLNLHAAVRDSKHTYDRDYSLFPQTDYTDLYSNQLKTIFPSSYCFQSVMFIPREEMKGYPCKEVLNKLDQMGGLDKECSGVCYTDGHSGKLKPIFKKSSYDEIEHELYVKDKAAGGLYLKVDVDEHVEKTTIYSVMAVLNKTPDNIFLQGIKKNEACIFVFLEETEEGANLYVLIQTKFSPLKMKFVKKIVENAVSARVIELQNWFYRMICTPQNQ